MAKRARVESLLSDGGKGLESSQGMGSGTRVEAVTGQRAGLWLPVPSVLPLPLAGLFRVTLFLDNRGMGAGAGTGTCTAWRVGS